MEEEDVWTVIDSDSSDLESVTGEPPPGRSLVSTSSLAFEPWSLETFQGESLVDVRESLSPFDSLELEEELEVVFSIGRPGEMSFPMLLQVWAKRANGLFFASSCKVTKYLKSVTAFKTYLTFYYYILYLTLICI